MQLETANKLQAAAIVVLWLTCCYYDLASATSHHDHVRTKSATTHVQRTQHLTAGMPAVTVVAGTAESSSADGSSGGNLHDSLFPKPNVFLNLIRSSVGVMQRSMDTFQGVSNKVFHEARKKIGGSHAQSSAASSRSNESGGGGTTVKRQVSTAMKKRTGFVKQVTNMLNTGITGVEQVTDLGLLLGNMGTHKIMAKLDGKSGNQELFNLLIKYVGSRVGKGTKGNVVQFIDDVGTISTFVAVDDDVTNAIATLMEKLMGNPKVSTAMVRLALTMLDSNPSTACLLDQLPLSPADVRMVFDVFVGSNGQMMLKTIAGLVSDLTTGPDTKAFLESALGMMSMFKSDTSGAEGSNNSGKPTSIVGSLTDFFTGGDDEVDDDDDYANNKSAPPPPPKVNNQKKAIRKSSTKKPAAVEDPWFSETGTTSISVSKTPKSAVEDEFFAKPGTPLKNPVSKKLKFDDGSFFSNTGTADKVHGSVNAKSKTVNVRKKVVTGDSAGSSSLDRSDVSNEKPKPTNVKNDVKKPNAGGAGGGGGKAIVEDFESVEYE